MVLKLSIMSKKFLKRISLILSLSFILFALPATANSLQQTQLLTINKVISADNHPFVDENIFLNHKTTLAELYLLSPHYLLWLTPDKQKIDAALQLIATANASGLNREDYNLTSLQTEWQQISTQQSVSYNDLALLDTAISINLIHFLSDLHFGRINSKSLKLNFSLEKKSAVFIPLILKAIQQDTILQLASLVEPSIPIYQKLKKALLDYRKNKPEQSLLKLEYVDTIRPRDSSQQIIELRQQLSLLGISINNNHSVVYDQTLVDQVKNFQFHHGLTQDGIIGRKTIKALNIPVSHRTQQIRLALERLRWLPKLQPGPSVLVNIPSFQLWAYPTDKMDEQQAINMKVIVGKSNKKNLKSPVFTANMRYLEFSPYWNIPRSITFKEILPKLKDNPFYLEERNMELVSGFHNNEFAQPLTDESFELLQAGLLKLRQRPGKGNALGKVKFIFPNNYNVYLHDTPSRFLFNRSKRDLSHGCIRIEKPSTLAQFLLKSKKGWNSSRISEAMHLQSPKRVFLKKAVPVVIYYSTASIVRNELIFYDDIYDYDAGLSEVLFNPRNED